jgi:DNA-binding NtrC family response regulator
VSPPAAAPPRAVEVEVEVSAPSAQAEEAEEKAAHPAHGNQDSRDGARRPAAHAPIMTLAESQRTLVARALEITRGNKKEAARLLGIPRQRLYRLIERYGIGSGAG